MFKNFWVYLVLIILSIPTIVPLFHEGLFSMHDDTQVVRVEQMHQSIVDGQFPVRWVADLGYGYGYPIFNFYSPLPYYFGAFCMFLGASALIATKLMFAVGILATPITMFLLAKKIWGVFPAIVAAVLYQYAPYHAVDIYVRGAVGEFWAIAILPLVFLGIVLLEKTKADKKNSYKFPISAFLTISISYAALITAHNITAMITSVFLAAGLVITLIYMGSTYVFQHISYKSLFIKTLFIVGSLVFGLGLSAFFWIPAFSETGYTNVNSVIGGGADYHDHFVYLEQLWDSPWGFGGSVQGKADGMSFKVGKIPMVLALFSLILLLWQMWTKSAKKRLIVYTICIVVATTCAIFMTTFYAGFIWDQIPLFAFIQYPWRFLVFIILGFALLSAQLFTIRKDFFVYSLSILLLLFVIYINSKYFVPQQYIVLDNAVYNSDQYVKWRVSRISDEYMPKQFDKPTSAQEVPNQKLIFDPEVLVRYSSIETDKYLVNYESEQSAVLHVNLAYFPGWTVELDEENHPFSIKNNGIELILPAGSHGLEIRKGNTIVETAGNIISLFCLIIIFGTMMRSKYPYVKKT